MRFGRTGRSPVGLVAGTALAVLVLLLALAPGTRNLARASQVDIRQLEGELMNPCENCGGKPLSGSYCGRAVEAKQELHDMVDKGMTHDQIIDAFVAEYGEWILSVPERKGFNLFAWILPVVGMVAGGGGLALFLRRTNEARREASGEGGSPRPGQGGPAPRAEAPAGSDLESLRRRLEREVLED